MGRPGVFFYVEGGGCSWACYECNSRSQASSNSVLYTPAFGQSVPFKCDGVATTVSGGVIQSSQTVAPGSGLAIPRDGYVMFFGTGFTSTNYFCRWFNKEMHMTPKTYRNRKGRPS